MIRARLARRHGGWIRAASRSGGALLVGGAALLAAAPLPAAADAVPAHGVPTPASGVQTDGMPAVTAGAGWLDWGVKESFRAYVEGPIADGTIDVTPPATRNADGTFRFGAGTGQLTDSDSLSAAFGGEVYFEGHGEGDDAELRLWITDPRLMIDGSTGTLLADVRSLSGADVVEYPDVPLASLDLDLQSVSPDDEGVVSLVDVAAILTPDGAPAFGGFYAAGDPLDPVSLTVTVDPEPGPTATPTASPTATPTPTETPAATPTSSPPALPPAPSPSESASWAPGEISSGLLDWGVKASFLTYISGGIANGGWTTTAGVTEVNGGFRWTSAYGDYDVADATGQASFAGGVRFTGHDGALDLSLSRPQVRFDGGATAVLLLDVTSKSLQSGAVTAQREVQFATLDLAAGSSDVSATTVRYGGIPATLTAAGAAGFGGFYEAGTALDPVSISFAVGGATVPGGGAARADGLAHTGGHLELAVVGGLLLLVGGALIGGARVAATRRRGGLT